MKDFTEKSFGFDNVGKIQTVCLSGRYADEKVNVMLQNDWKIIDKYTVVSEDYPYHCSSTLFFVLGHEDSNAQIPLTEREIERQRRHEEERKRADEQWRKIMEKEDMT